MNIKNIVFCFDLDVLCFSGLEINLNKGLIHHVGNKCTLHWSKEPDIRNELIAQSMRRNRLDNIMKYFRAAVNSRLHQEDEFAKIFLFWIS